MEEVNAMDGFEAGTSGAFAVHQLQARRAEATARRPQHIGRVRHGVGVGLIRLGSRLSGAGAS
jgi:hypothetical protein